ncbi:hypothetical protein LCGC14_0595010 [marine sediment metagenome]|uniref:Uncharacterized protein n=1 Tax=marine sediment metagenome TaxID=412755 RepID=A0A0F9RVY0_9ZZZZ
MKPLRSDARGFNPPRPPRASWAPVQGRCFKTAKQTPAQTPANPRARGLRPPRAGVLKAGFETGKLISALRRRAGVAGG